LPGVGRWISPDLNFSKLHKSKPTNDLVPLWRYGKNNPVTLIDKGGNDTFYFGLNFSAFDQTAGTTNLGTGVSRTVGIAIDTDTGNTYGFVSGEDVTFDDGKVTGFTAGISGVSGYVNGDTGSEFFGYGSEDTLAAGPASLSQLSDENGTLAGYEYGVGTRVSLPGAASVEGETGTQPEFEFDLGESAESIAKFGEDILKSFGDATGTPSPSIESTGNSDIFDGPSSPASTPDFDPSNLPDQSIDDSAGDLSAL
jgi:hypothetical protein